MSAQHICFFAPYAQNEMSLYACSLARHVIRIVNESNRYSFTYFTTDSPKNFTHSLISESVVRVFSPSDFLRHLHHCNTVFWFTPDLLYRKVLPKNMSHFWFSSVSPRIDDADYHRFSNGCQLIFYPSDDACKSMRYRVGSLAAPYYADPFNKMVPVKPPCSKTSIRIIISMCGIRSLITRTAILEKLRPMLSARPDFFVTILSDGIQSKDEGDKLSDLGMQFSDRFVYVSSFSDFEFANILNAHDVFIDMNRESSVGYFINSALYAGLTVVAYDTELNKTLLSDGKYGFLLRSPMTQVMPIHIGQVFYQIANNVLEPQLLQYWNERRQHQNSLRDFDRVMSSRRQTAIEPWCFLSSRPVKGCLSADHVVSEDVLRQISPAFESSLVG